MSGWAHYRTWPVDFSGFGTIDSIVERIEVLRPLVLRGHQDICWAAWEIENLDRLLHGNALVLE